MAKKLMLGFTNTAGKTVSITIPEPKATLAQADCTAAMDAIIAKNIFSTTGGELVSKLYAKVIDTTEDVLYDATP